MIPTLLLLGLVMGAFVHDRRSLVRTSVLGMTAAVLWGVGVGVMDGSVKTFLGGSVLALANLLVGAAISTSLRNISRLVAGKRRTPTY